MSEEDVKKVYFEFWDPDTGEYDYIWMEEQAFIEWEAALAQEYQEIEERRKEADRLDRDAWLYARDD